MQVTGQKTINIFSIPEPDICTCIVEDFTVGHKLLTIKVFNSASKKSLYLTFVLVSYFSGPTGWEGANFYIAPQDEWLDHMIRLNLYNLTRESFLNLDHEIANRITSQFHLYQVDALDIDFTIKIFASNHVDINELEEAIKIVKERKAEKENNK